MHDSDILRNTKIDFINITDHIRVSLIGKESGTLKYKQHLHKFRFLNRSIPTTAVTILKYCITFKCDVNS